MAKVKSKQFKLSYDQEGDVLDIFLDKAKSAISKEVSEDVFVRLDEKTHEVLGFMILNFQKRSTNLQSRSIPISAHFELSKAF